MKLLIKWKSSPLIGAIIILSNFYLYVLYFSADRLKFSFIFMTLAFVHIGARRFTAYSLFSLISHAQNFIVYVAMLFKMFTLEVKRFISHNKIKKSLLVCSFLTLIMLLLMSEQIIVKFKAYIDFKGHSSFRDVIKLFAFFMLTLPYSKNKSETFYIFLPFFVVALRPRRRPCKPIWLFHIFLFYAIRINRGFNIGIAITTLYFSIKTYFFIEKIILYGNGFIKL